MKKMSLPDLLEECLSWCQDDQAGLYEREAEEIRELIKILRKKGIVEVGQVSNALEASRP